jgi:hypothetical protein
MGHGLEKMSRAMHGKLPIVIPEGGIRPVAPFAAAKFATECNIAVRNHMPVLKHWKDYKKNSALLQQFRGTLKVHYLGLPISLSGYKLLIFSHILLFLIGNV